MALTDLIQDSTSEAARGASISQGHGDSTWAPAAVLTEGQVLNNTYRIVRTIGEGGMGVVYEATHARLSGRYAVKVLLGTLSNDRRARAQFEREARTTSLLHHPNIVQVIDFNQAPDGTEYLVMEYLQGRSLADRLDTEGAFPPTLVARIVDQIAAALAAAHGHGIVHRDLKPENVFLVPVEGRQDEQVKVLDFGISKVKDLNRDSDGTVNAVVGTPHYMAPEQCLGRTADVDPATDQFALAIITYEMLTGHVPFRGEKVGIVLSRVVHDDAPPMGIDPAVEEVVRRGLAKSIHNRFPSVTAYAAALHAASAGHATNQKDRSNIASGDHARPLTRDTVPIDGALREGPGASHRQRSWSGALVTMAVVGYAAWFVAGRDPGRPKLLQRLKVSIPGATAAGGDTRSRQPGKAAAHLSVPKAKLVVGTPSPASVPMPAASAHPAPNAIAVVPLLSTPGSSPSAAPTGGTEPRAANSSRTTSILRGSSARSNKRVSPVLRAVTRGASGRARRAPLVGLIDEDAIMPLDAGGP